MGGILNTVIVFKIRLLELDIAFYRADICADGGDITPSVLFNN